MFVFISCIRVLCCLLFLLSIVTVHGAPTENILLNFISSEQLTNKVVSEFSACLKVDDSVKSQEKTEEIIYLLELNLKSFFEYNKNGGYPSFIRVSDNSEKSLTFFYKEVGEEIGLLINICAAAMFGVIDISSTNLDIMQCLKKPKYLQNIISCVLVSVKNCFNEQLLVEQQRKIELETEDTFAHGLVVDGFNMCIITLEKITRLISNKDLSYTKERFESLLSMITSILEVRMYDLPNIKGQVLIDMSSFKCSEVQIPLPWEEDIFYWGVHVGASPLDEFKNTFKCHIGIGTIKKSYNYWNKSNNPVLQKSWCTNYEALGLRRAIIVRHISSVFYILLKGGKDAEDLGFFIKNNECLLNTLVAFNSSFYSKGCRKDECLGLNRELYLKKQCEIYIEYLYINNSYYDPRQYLFYYQRALEEHDGNKLGLPVNADSYSNSDEENHKLLRYYLKKVSSDQETLFTKWFDYTKEEDRKYFGFEIFIRALPTLENIKTSEVSGFKIDGYHMKSLSKVLELVVIILTISDDKTRPLHERFSESLIRQTYVNELKKRYGNNDYI